MFTEEVAAQALSYSVTTPFLLFLVVFFYFIGENPKRSPSSKNEKFERNIPVVTQLFPFTVPLFDGIITLLRLHKSGVQYMDQVQKKFGKIYCAHIVHKKVFVINDVEMVENLLSTKNPLHLNKSNELSDNLFINSFRDGLVNSKFHVWSPHRKILNHCFSYSSLQNYLERMNMHGSDLIRNLRNLEPTNDRISDTDFIYNTLHCHLEKITADIVLGDSKLSEEAAAEYDQHLKNAQKSVLGVALIPLLKFPPFRYFNPKINRQHESFQFLESFFEKITKRCCQQYEQELKSIKDAQSGIADNTGVKPYRCMIQEMVWQRVTTKEINNQVAAFMIAGTKSTNLSIQMLMLHLALNPDYQSRCREEIDHLIDLKKTTGLIQTNNLNGVNFSMNDLANLKYLERCILECIRITPIFPIFIRKLEAPLKISEDLELPSGSNVAVPVWTIHRDPDYFSNPEKFDPDRFLPENVKKRHPFSFIPFSSGPRNCIAYKMAVMEIKVIIAGILRNFEISTTDKLYDVKLLFAVTIKPERNYHIVLKRRRF